jgi:hypothetical protein
LLPSHELLIQEKYSEREGVELSAPVTGNVWVFWAYEKETTPDNVKNKNTFFMI